MALQRLSTSSASLRVRLAVASGLLSALVLAGFAAGAYLVAADGLRSAVDDEMRERGQVISSVLARRPLIEFLPPLGLDSSQDLFGSDDGGEVIAASGALLGGRPAGAVGAIPVTETERAVAAGEIDEPVFRTEEIDGTIVRLGTTPIEGGGALRLSADMSDIERGLDSLRDRLAVGTVAVVTLVALGAWWFAGRFVAPVSAVAAAAESLARRQDLPSRLEVTRSDEVGRLASSFNALVEALALAREQQRRLVADASHELRTPLTSLRTKIEFLHSAPELPEAKREEVIGAAVLDLEGLSDLVDELVTLAADTDSADENPVEVDLGDLVEAEAARFARVSGRAVEVTTEPHALVGRPRSITRAVSNLLGNADKFSPAGAPIEVVQRGAEVEVRDRGPGIPPAERSRVFDRFYRSPSASGVDGSGIGLAIVARVAESHDGRVWATEADGGGAAVGFSVGPTEGRESQVIR